MLQIVYNNSESKWYNLIGKIRFGSKSLNFTCKKKGLIIIDFSNIRSFEIV